MLPPPHLREHRPTSRTRCTMTRRAAGHGWALRVGFWVGCKGFVAESEDSDVNSYQNETRSIPTPQTHPCTGAPTPSRRLTMLPWAFFIGNVRAAAVKNGRGSLNLVKRDVWIQHGDDGRALRCSLWQNGQPETHSRSLQYPLTYQGAPHTDRVS
jgi:hypothetical protein